MGTLTTSEYIHVYQHSQLQSPNFTPDAVTAAYVAGLAALREKAKAEENASLTLEELQEMDGEPAYFVCVKYPELSMWCIVWVDSIFGVKKVSGQGRCLTVHQEFCTEDSYGKTWLAYRSKPEG